MQRRMTVVLLAGIIAVSLSRADEPTFSFPLIHGYGGVATLPAAADPPQKGVKVVFDITAESKPDEVNRGLDSVARYLNLNAQAGNKASDARVALVLHGSATKCALSDEAFQKHTNVEHNPNLPLLRELKKHGVELLVCGQSLARNKFLASEVADKLTIAVSAMTVNVNKQRAGYTYLAIH